jgi:hypothetical protein
LQVKPTRRVFPQRGRAFVALCALTLVAVVLAACGGSGSSGSGSGDASSLLKQAVANAQKIRSGKAHLKLSANLQGGDSPLQGPISLDVSGPFEVAGSGALPKFDLALNVAAQGQSFQAGLTSTSDNLYVQFGGTAYALPASTMAKLKQSLKQQGASTTPKLDLKTLGLNPLGWLKDAKVTGKESVGGVQADHVTAQLNTSALLDDVDKLLAQFSKQVPSGAAGQQVPSSIPPNARKQITDAVERATIDAWIGSDDKLLRKVAFSLTLAPKSAHGPKSIDVALSLELDDVNQPQTITAPANPKPIQELLGQLGGLLGGLGGGSSLFGGGSGSSGSSSGSSGSGSSGAPGTAQIQRYSACLKAAGNDVAKATQCAQLLTK